MSTWYEESFRKSTNSAPTNEVKWRKKELDYSGKKRNNYKREEEKFQAIKPDGHVHDSLKLPRKEGDRWSKLLTINE